MQEKYAHTERYPSVVIPNAAGMKKRARGMSTTVSRISDVTPIPIFICSKAVYFSIQDPPCQGAAAIPLP